MVFSLVFSLPGLMMLIPLGLVVGYFAEKERRKALAGSNVKVRAVDVMASVKVGSSLMLYPIYSILFTIAFYMFCGQKMELSRTQCIEATIVFFIFFPILSIISIRSADGVVTHYKMLQSRIITFFHHDKFSDLKIMRKQLKAKVRGVVNKLGP